MKTWTLHTKVSIYHMSYCYRNTQQHYLIACFPIPGANKQEPINTGRLLVVRPPATYRCEAQHETFPSCITVLDETKIHFSSMVFFECTKCLWLQWKLLQILFVFLVLLTAASPSFVTIQGYFRSAQSAMMWLWSCAYLFTLGFPDNQTHPRARKHTDKILRKLLKETKFPSQCLSLDLPLNVMD